MAGPALAYEYRYPHASTLEGTPRGANLRLATWSDRGEPHPHFFQGRLRLRRPGRAAELLRGLVDVVRSRFYLPPAMLARILSMKRGRDPSYTCRIRAFSFPVGLPLSRSFPRPLNVAQRNAYRRSFRGNRRWQTERKGHALQSSSSGW